MALAHARFSRRYAHFESTVPNSPPIQSHESALIDTSLMYDDQAQQLERQAVSAQRNMAIFVEEWKRIPNTIASPVAYFQKFGGDLSAWGKAVAIVDASHTSVFSYLWNVHSYEHMNSYADKEGTDALNKVVFAPDSHSMINAFVVNFGLAVSARVFSTWNVWRQEPDESFILAFAPMSDYKQFNCVTVEIETALNDDAAAAEAIRGTVKGFWRIKPLTSEGKQAAGRMAKRARARTACETDQLKTVGFKRPNQTTTPCPLSVPQPLCSHMCVALSLSDYVRRPGATRRFPTPSSDQQANQEHPLRRSRHARQVREKRQGRRLGGARDVPPPASPRESQYRAEQHRRRGPAFGVQSGGVSRPSR